MALTKVSYSMIQGAPFNVLDYGADSTGATPSTNAFQAAIDAAQPSHGLVFIPSGTYLIDDTLSVYNGTQLEGETYYQYPAGFGVPVKATTITFTPTSSKPLFDYSWDQPAPPPGFVFHTSIQGLHLKATANGSYGIKLNSVIYGLFANMSIDGFGTAIYCDATINNRFENIYCTGSSYSNVVYAGNNETTDVWEQCTFRNSNVGVRFEGSSIAVRFNSCLWEIINYYGIDVHSKCQSIMVMDAYCEDVPYNTDANSCMFRVGVHTGSSLSTVTNHLIVTGGVFNGRSAGASGQVFKIGSCWGIIVNGIVANRYSLLFETDSIETKPNSIVVSGIEGTGWGGTIDDTSKWIGSVPNGVLNSGDFSIDGIFSNVTARSAYYNVGGAAWFSNYGTPEGVVTAPVGSLYSRLDGGAGTSLYVKQSGSGNTGWVAK